MPITVLPTLAILVAVREHFFIPSVFQRSQFPAIRAIFDDSAPEQDGVHHKWQSIQIEIKKTWQEENFLTLVTYRSMSVVHEVLYFILATKYSLRFIVNCCNFKTSQMLVLRM